MLYEFVCEKCKYITTLSLSVKDRNTIQKCIKCQGKMKRQIGCPGLIFKGNGFYTTDYKKPKDLRKQAIKEKKRRKEGKSGYTEI